MKKIILQKARTFSFIVLGVLFFIQSSYKANAAEQDFLIILQNVCQTAPNILEFEIYIFDTDVSQSLEMATFQAGINFNLSGMGATFASTMTTVVAGSSQLPANQAPVSISTTAAGLIRIAGRAAPGCGAGFIIPTTAPGVRVGTFRITSATNFIPNSTPNFTFTSSTATNPSYATRFAYYAAANCQNTQTVVTPGVNANVLENPVPGPCYQYPLLTVTPSNQLVEAAAGDIQYSVTSNTSWTAQCDQSWCTVTPSGTGNGSITATYTQNTTPASRTANITVSASGTSSVVATLVQSAPALSVTPAVSNVNPTEGQTSFSVNSNSTWAASSDQSWCMVTNSGAGDGSITASYTENNTAEQRSAIITVTTPGLSPITVTLIQAAPYIEVAPLSQDVDAVADTAHFNVASNTTWTVSGNQSWCIVNPSGGFSNETITAIISENTWAAPRVATLTFMVNGLPPYEVTITQEGALPVLAITPASQSVNVAAGEITYNVTSNATWSVSCDQSWCMVTNSGSGDGSIAADYSENNTPEQRSAIITVTTPGLSPVSVTLNQAAPYIEVAPLSQNTAAVVDTIQFNVVSNTHWTITCNQPWCSVNAYEGNGNEIITAFINENTWASPRVATITFHVNGLPPAEVTITQAAAIPFILATPAAQSVGALLGNAAFNVTSNTSWTVLCDQSWCTVTSSGSGNGSITVSYTQNASPTPRTANITISAPGVTPVVVTLVQDGMPESALLLSIQNVIQTAPNVFEFDIFLLDTDPSQDLQLATIQEGIGFNPAILNGGAITAGMTTIVPGSSQLPAAMQPISVNTTNPGLIRVAGRAAPGAGNGFIISKSAPGTRIARLRFTNSLPFASNSTPDMAFTSNTASNPFYPTRVAIYAGTVNTQLVVTPGVNAVVLENPLLSQPLITNSVNGNINGEYYQMNTPSTSYQVSASNLFEDLIITSSTSNSYPEDCQIQISLSPEEGYTNQIQLTPINGMIDTTIYVKPGCEVVPFTCWGSIAQSSIGAQTDQISVYLENDYWFIYAPVLKIGDVKAVSDSSVLIPVNSVTDFNVCAGHLYIDYNPSVLSFIGVTNAYNDLVVCNNCLNRHWCPEMEIGDPECQINTMVTNIDSTHSSLQIHIYYSETGGTYEPVLVCPEGEKFFDIEFVYHGGSSELSFTDGQYSYACNSGYFPLIIMEPFEDFFRNGSVSPYPPKSVNLELTLEGLYIPALGQMNKAYGRDFPGTIADEITVGLARSTFPYNIEYVADSVLLDQNGNCQLIIPGNLNGEYYIVITHRNSIETWSKFPVSFSQDTIAYNFTDLKSRAYNDNLKLKGDKYCIYAADVNQDGFVDTGDMTLLDNESNQFATGYNASDANGDGTTDSGDIVMADNNSYTFTTSFRPYANSPAVVTGNISNITHSTATGGGVVVHQGASTVTSRGICWNTSPNPGIADNVTSNGTGAGNFVSIMDNLMPNTVYYVRAYATNAETTVYGYQINFTTSASYATVSTDEAINITETSATCGGNITGSGGVPVTQRGVCWNTQPNPTTTDFFTVDGNGPGNFSSSLSGLLPNTLYYVRAYAINSVGIAYGNEVTFTTSAFLPTLNTTVVTGITSSTAISGGSITGDGGAQVFQRGVCFDTNPMPTTANDTLLSGSGTGSFTNPLTGLNPYTTYYVRAFATNIAGTAYGNEISFTTLAAIPTITTETISDITGTSAISGGNITSDGGAPVTQRGVCWSSNPAPTIEDQFTSDGTGIGAFESSLSGLSPSNTYYVRAYAINSAGTAYGNEFSFLTGAVLPEISTTTPGTITAMTAVCGGSITSDGGAQVVQRGVCFGTNQMPTTANDTLLSGSGTGSFTSTLTGLIPHTTYYVRAFATNIAGTAYGNEISFTTLAELPTLTTETASNITGTSAISGGMITSDGGAPVTQRGVCWSSNPNPTLTDQFTNDGGDSGAFTSSLTGLSPNSIFYVRAYAINSAGTAYGNEVSFTTALFIPGNGVADIDGNSYSTVILVNQEWMGENLKVSRYSNGDAITQALTGTEWSSLSSGGWCWMNNDNQYENPYGRLYNHYAVTDSRNLCPTGWHVPTDAEWTVLSDYLGGSATAGGKMKETGTLHWNAPNTGATNASSFTAVPGGYRTNDGTFANLGNHGIWWSSTEMNASFSWYRSLFYNTISLNRGNNQKKYGFSVRCLKN